MSRVVVIALVAAAALLAQAKKEYKDAGEHQLYSDVSKEMAANRGAKAVELLDAWKQKYPASDFADDRQALYVQAHAAAKQPAKAVDAAAPLLSKDIDAALGSAGNVIRVLFTVVASIQQVGDASAEQLATAKKAAAMLAAYDKKPEGLTDDAWTQARSQLRNAARAALIYVALAPGTQAFQKKDCATAEAEFTRALQEHPDSAQAAWSLGSAQLCLHNRNQPQKASAALYAFARAAAVDPVKGMVDPKWQQETVIPYLEKVYAKYHGVDPEGLKQLKAAAVGSPFPPAGFHIKSVTEIAEEKRQEFEKSNPQLALWMKIKAALADTGGEQYFEANLKHADVPQLRGVLVEARPACRPKELVVAVPLPDSPRPLQPEIVLKLDKPMAGKPDPDTEFQWRGVPSAFSSSPFMLTMEAETAKMDGLRTSPCAPAAVKKAGAAKKK